jgi:hypothetical protein
MGTTIRQPEIPASESGGEQREKVRDRKWGGSSYKLGLR